MLLLVLGLISGLSACLPNNNKVYSELKSDSIMGGQAVSATSTFAKRVIYLSVNVNWVTNTNSTSTVTTVEQKGFCTATAISPTVLITAGHCVANLEPSQIYAVLSNNPWNHSLQEKEWVKVNKIIMRSDYKDKINEGGLIENDIALLQLAEPISPERVSKIAAPKQTSPTFSLVSIGYGINSPLQNAPADQDPKDKDTYLYYVMKTVEKYSLAESLFNINQNDLTGFCSGDSGGPGFIYDSTAKDYYIVGIASFIAISSEEKSRIDPTNIYNTCSGRGYYSNILFPDFKDWIDKTMSGL